MKLNHTTYVGKKCLHFITYNVLRGLKNIIQTQFKIQLSCRAAVLRDVNDCTLAIYQYWRESDWCNWIYSAHTVQIWSVPADYEEVAGGVKGAGFGLRPKMCRPSVDTENSRRTREKPLVPRVYESANRHQSEWNTKITTQNMKRKYN